MSTAACVFSLHTSFILRRSVSKEKPIPTFKEFLCRSKNGKKLNNSGENSDGNEKENSEKEKLCKTTTTTNGHVVSICKKNLRGLKCQCKLCRKEEKQFVGNMTKLLMISSPYQRLVATRFFQRAMWDVQCIAASFSRRERAKRIVFACKARGLFVDRVLFFGFLTGYFFILFYFIFRF